MSEYEAQSLWGTELPEAQESAIPKRVQYGDLWLLGEHRLLCGSASDTSDVARLFDGEQFALCFTSPPYTDQRSYKVGKFNWHDLMCGTFDQMTQHIAADGHILVNLGTSHKDRQVDMYYFQWLMHCAAVGWPLFGQYIWDKGPSLPGDHNGRLASTHEFVFHFNQECESANKWVKTKRMDVSRGFREKNGSIKPPTSPDKYGQSHKVPDSVIRINRECSRGIHTENHPAVFPVALAEFMLRTWSQLHDIVYDPFCGSGTSIISAENLRRRCYAIDIEPTYCDLAIERWQQHTGKAAILIERQETAA